MTRSASRSRILVVDDEECLTRVFDRLLSRLGFVVVTTTSPRTALALATSEPFDALISDIHMPELRGDELVARLRERGVTMPVLLTSGVVDHTPYGPVLAKPFTFDELQAALAAIGIV